MAEGENSIAVQNLPDGRTAIILSGRWTLDTPLPDWRAIVSQLDHGSPQPVEIIGRHLAGWDSALPALILQLQGALAASRVETRLADLPEGVRRLLAMAAAAPEADRRPQASRRSGFERIGETAIAAWRGALAAMDFVGAFTQSLGRLMAGRARFRRVDFWLVVQQSGAEALPITAVIALLMGMIFAFVGVIQLRQFGADIYVANLVAVAMSREMGAVMTAIVLAGRTGAAFAAQIGAMQGNEEIDALSTLGLSPMEFLVLPRVAALVLMVPLLCLYADGLGVFGGMLVGVSLPDVTTTAYLAQTRSAIGLTDVAIGVVKSTVFGLLVALAGCFAGMGAGRDAAAVGHAATRAVVNSILAIIIADALFAIALNNLGL